MCFIKIPSVSQSPLYEVHKIRAYPPAVLLPSSEDIALCLQPLITAGPCVSGKAKDCVVMGENK